MIEEFGKMFEEVISAKAGSKEISEWYKVYKQKKLKQVLVRAKEMRKEAQERDHQVKLLNNRAVELDALFN